jgi:hypothetical protein
VLYKVKMVFSVHLNAVVHCPLDVAAMMNFLPLIVVRGFAVAPVVLAERISALAVSCFLGVDFAGSGYAVLGADFLTLAYVLFENHVLSLTAAAVLPGQLSSNP